MYRRMSRKIPQLQQNHQYNWKKGDGTGPACICKTELFNRETCLEENGIILRLLQHDCKAQGPVAHFPHEV
jgi:hypothetical protein